MSEIPPSSEDLERRLRDHADSELRGEEQRLAASGSCPTPAAEVQDLQAGRIRDPGRREALARHLVACPHCLRANLTSLAEDPGTAPGNRGQRRTIILTAAAAAALVIGLVLLGPWLRQRETGRALAEAYWTDPDGIDVREPVREPDRRRILVAAKRDGHLALVVSESGQLRLETVQGEALWTGVRGGEEVLLPLDGEALMATPGATYIVVWTEEPPSADGLRSLGRQALAGEPLPAGAEVLFLRP